LRKSTLLLIIICLCVLVACNFPIYVISHPIEKIPFPTPVALFTQSPLPAISPTPTSFQIPQPLGPIDGYFSYFAQSGDTLNAIARHFGVNTDQITSPQILDTRGLISPGQLLIIPDVLGVTFNSYQLLPDSEVIYSPSASDFDIDDYIKNAGGYLSTFYQQVGTEVLSGSEIVQRVAENTSINPRLLLAVIEFRSHWVNSIPQEPNLVFPLSFYYQEYQGFYLECSLAAKWINMGYYGWREGLFTEIIFSNRSAVRVAPQLNAGSVALQYFLAQIYSQGIWENQLIGSNTLVSLHETMFGDPWARAALIEPLFQAGVILPVLELPFTPGEEWALTGGLHYDWNSGTPSGALDFAPVTGERGCTVSRVWVLASAPGKVIRSSGSIVIIDLVDTHQEPTGWELFYMHVAERDRIPVGTVVNLDDPIGHPSCEGGISTGTHVHINRKYKGEWIGAGNPFPFILSGWTAVPGTNQFRSSLVKDGLVVTSLQDGGIDSRIFR
jgi:LasA protease